MPSSVIARSKPWLRRAQDQGVLRGEPSRQERSDSEGHVQVGGRWQRGDLRAVREGGVQLHGVVLSRRLQQDRGRGVQQGLQGIRGDGGEEEGVHGGGDELQDVLGGRREGMPVAGAEQDVHVPDGAVAAGRVEVPSDAAGCAAKVPNGSGDLFGEDQMPEWLRMPQMCRRAAGAGSCVGVAMIDNYCLPFCVCLCVCFERHCVR